MAIEKLKNENLTEKNLNGIKTSNDTKEESINARVTLRFEEKEQRILSRIVSNLKDNNIEMNLNKIFKFILKNTEPDSLTKQIVKSKKQAEEILKKAQTEVEKIWF